MLLTRDEMHNYQNRTVDFITAVAGNTAIGCGIWLDMGLGKSVSAATAVVDMQSDMSVGRVLIIAPKRVAMTTWPLELRTWDHLMYTRFSVISGDAKQRTAAILQRADIHIISRDNVAWLVRMVGKQWPWDMVVIDESSSFKSQSSNRWKALKHVLRMITRVVELSATPAPQGLIDLWPQFYLLDKGERLGATEKAFKKRWFIEDRESRLIVPRAHAEDEIHSLVSDITIHMNAEDYLDMPELIHNKVLVDLPRDQMIRYQNFERDMFIEFDGLDLEVHAENAAVLTGKLLQFANGAMYVNELREWELLHDEKIEALKEIVESHAGYPILVAYNFKSDLQRLKKAFPFATVMDDDPDTQLRWNNGEIPMLLTHPASSGHGLNLQRGSNVICWFGLSWSLEYYLQLNGRLYRQGQTKNTVVIHHIIARHTVDERVLSVLGRKNATQKELLMAVREVV
jgi:SNF2 family DNA or RNA helicase